MTNILTTSLIVSISYCILKYIETRVLDKNDEKPLKFIMRDTFIVFVASCFGIFIIEQLNDLQKGGINILGGSSEKGEIKAEVFIFGISVK